MARSTAASSLWQSGRLSDFRWNFFSGDAEPRRVPKKCGFEAQSLPKLKLSRSVNTDTFIGGAGVDVFTAPLGGADVNKSTFTVADNLDGGAGVDTLMIIVDGSGGANSAFPAAAKVANIEIVEIINGGSGAPATSLTNVAKYSGIEQLWQSGPAADVTNATSDVTIGMREDAGDFNVFAASSTQTSLKLAADALESQTEVGVSGAGLKTINLAGTTTVLPNGDREGRVTLVDVDAAGSGISSGGTITTLNIETAGIIDVKAQDIDSVKTVNLDSASGFTSKVFVNTLTRFNGGDGNDQLQIQDGLASLTKDFVFEGGAGTDMLYLNFNATGSDTSFVLVGSGEMTFTGEGYALINTTDAEILKINLLNADKDNPDSVTLDMDKLTLREVHLDESSTVTNLQNLDIVTATANDASGDYDFVLKGQRNSVDPTEWADGAGTVNFVADGAVGKFNTIAANGVSGGSDYKTLVLSGKSGVIINNNGTDAKAITVDASDLSGVLDITTTVGKADKITLGSGDDIVTLKSSDDDATSTFSAMDKITSFGEGDALKEVVISAANLKNANSVVEGAVNRPGFAGGPNP